MTQQRPTRVAAKGEITGHTFQVRIVKRTSLGLEVFTVIRIDEHTDEIFTNDFHSEFGARRFLQTILPKLNQSLLRVLDRTSNQRRGAN